MGLLRVRRKEVGRVAHKSLQLVFPRDLLSANIMPKPTFLLTNDDGINVYFIQALAKSLIQYGNVYVAAPAQEQSWVGRRITRSAEVSVSRYNKIPGVTAWEINGTPSDSVNIALSYLLPEQPNVIVSGINVGWNAMLPLLFSSGTVAGALEGAVWGIPSVALSMHLHEEDFEAVKQDSINPPAHIRARVDIAAKLGAEFAASKVGTDNLNHTVFNINFPTSPKPDTPWINTQPGQIDMGSLFAETRMCEVACALALESRLCDCVVRSPLRGWRIAGRGRAVETLE